MKGSLRVLIVEDSEYDAKLLIYELQRGGHDSLHERVETCEAMTDALDRQEWDLIIADYVMPHFSGLEALRLVKDRGLDIPFIIVSGRIGEDVAVEAMKAGAHDYLLKDNLTRLNSAIERELREAIVRRERKQAEQELAVTQQQLFQAQKMDAVGQVAAGMAHEINNRLTVVLGHLDLCLDRVAQKSALYQSLLTVQKNIRLAGKLSNKLLLFGQKQLQFKTPINLNYNIREIRDMLKRRLVDENIDLHFCLSRNLWKVYADSPNMDQVVINLVLNARDAIAGGGSITIRTDNTYDINKHEAKESEPGKKERYVCFTISDTGDGMDESVLPHIFEPFFTTKQRGQGTGLGLSVVYGIVKSHEGWIDVSSRPGEGSTFKIFLPAIKKKSIDVYSSQLHFEQFDNKEAKILLVEDDPEVLSLTKKVLKKNGYLVNPCRSVAEALAIFEQENGCFDLVLCDIILPDGRGADLVVKLKQIKPSLNALLVSGYADDGDILGRHKLRGIPFMPKPYTFDDLLKQMRLLNTNNRA
jgi:signal transduction histidine kinase